MREVGAPSAVTSEGSSAGIPGGWPGWIPIATIAVALSVAAAPAGAQEERALGASDSAELSWVLTTGNSDANTFGLRNLFRYTWAGSDLTWEVGLVRAESRDGDRFAIGSATDFEVIKPTKQVDSNRAYSKARYRRNLSPSFFWYASLDSERNEPANVSYRFTPAAGAGNTWTDTEALRLRTGYGLTYTAEKLERQGSNRFAGYQLFYDLATALTASTTLESNLTFDGNLRDGNDVRFDWLNGASVAINEHLALKATLRLLLRNVPALEETDLRDSSGAVAGSVTVPKEKLDTTVSTSLVINF